MEELGYVNTIVYNTSFNYENEDSIYRAVELFIFIYLVGVTLCYTYILSSTFINNIVKWCFLSLWRRSQKRRRVQKRKTIRQKSQRRCRNRKTL